jgi:putative membrane protein
MWNHMGYYLGERGWGWMLLGGLHMLALWVLVIGAIWLLVRALSNSARRTEAPARPLDILKERYARGEIDKAEFDQRRADLER